MVLQNCQCMEVGLLPFPILKNTVLEVAGNVFSWVSLLVCFGVLGLGFSGYNWEGKVLLMCLAELRREQP